MIRRRSAVAAAAVGATALAVIVVIIAACVGASGLAASAVIFSALVASALVVFAADAVTDADRGVAIAIGSALLALVDIPVAVGGAVVGAALRVRPGRRRAPSLLGLVTGRVKFWAGSPSAGPGAGMRVAAWLMPRTTGREWLAEADSVLFEAAPEARRSIERSYLFTVPHVFAAAWAGALSGRLRIARGPGLPGGGRE